MKETRRYAVAFSGLVLVAGAARAIGCIGDLPPDAAPPGADAGGAADSLADADADGGAGPEAEAGLTPDAGSLCGNGVVDLQAGEQCDPGPRPSQAATASCSPQCKMRCPDAGFVWSGNNHCYWTSSAFTFDLDPPSSRPPAAADLCHLGMGHIVTFASEGEFSAVERGVPLTTGPPPYWVGLSASGGKSFVSVVPNEPGWDSTCSGCYAHVDAKGVIARYVDADGGQSTQACVAASVDAADPLWHERPCQGIKTRVVCEREPIGAQFASCEAGVCIDLVATYATKRYVFVATAATSDGAAQACASIGGRLAIFKSRGEREELWFQLAQVPSQTPTAVWIGLSLGDAGAAPDGAATAPPWLWDDGTPANAPDAYPPPWGDRQPVVGGATTRAYLRAYASEIDDTLARNDAPQATPPYTLPYVCELPVEAGPPDAQDGAPPGP